VNFIGGAKSRFVRPEMGNTGLRFEVRAGGDSNFKDFTLDNPPRIVLDIENVKETVKSESLSLAAGPVERVRVGRPKPGVLRVVLDVKELASYIVTRGPGSLIVTLGGNETTGQNLK
jgi:hypothetical protein